MIDARDFAQAGQKYLGTPYKKLDCQAFVEKCLQDCGLEMNLKGSNAWYRKMDWVGTPEECRQRFGSIPDGALLFIWDDKGGEVARGYNDGLGNASHMGIVTHTGQGAIHSSATRDCVAESKFADKTIANGGWNRIGLSKLFDYGPEINALLSGEQQNEVVLIMQYGVVNTPDGNPVKLRPTKSTSKPYLAKIPNGTQLLISDSDGQWCETSWDGRTGYVMQAYVVLDGQQDQSSEIKISMNRQTAENLYNAIGHALYGGVG